MTYRMYAVRLFCLNSEETFTFYHDVLGWAPGFHDAEMGRAEFPLEGATIALERADPSDPSTWKMAPSRSRCSESMRFDSSVAWPR